ncbi:MAG: hypothetical protein H6825_07895, partial [Planctomycetes bacterium]|nr:hypothetical protein [Planctomycetota bacterium]
ALPEDGSALVASAAAPDAWHVVAAGASRPAHAPSVHSFFLPSQESA